MILINSSPKDALKIFQPFLPIFVPVGVGALLGVLEREGIEAHHVDEQVEDDPIGRIRDLAERLPRPYIFGFSVLTATYRRAVKVAGILKRLYPDCVVVFGGVHPTAVPDEILASNHADIVLRGEGEHVLPELYRCIKNGKDYAHLPSISFRQESAIIHNPRCGNINDLNDLPSFPYHRFEARRDRYDLGFVVSSRGCPYNCVFCSNRITTGRRYRYRSNDLIVAEIELLRKKYDARNIIFLDDNLLVNKERIFDLTAQLRRKGLDRGMHCSFQARGDNVSRELLVDMRRSGFNSIFLGLETASEELMKFVDKGETVACCLQAARMAKEIGFHVSGTFIFGLPGETHRDRMDAICLSREIDLDMVRYNNATPYPGTRLWDIASRDRGLHMEPLYGNFNSVSTFIENPFRKIPFSYVPPGSRESEIRADILVGYLAFYLNPKKIARIFAKGRSEGAGWFSAGSSWAARLRKAPAALMLAGMLALKFGALFAGILFTRRGIGVVEFVRVMLGRRRSGLSIPPLPHDPPSHKAPPENAPEQQRNRSAGG